jgi:4'-phosphopantetheinyl transferase
MSFFSTMAQGLSSMHRVRLEASLPRAANAPDTVQIWHLNVERWAGCAMLERAHAVLTDAERVRAARLRRPVARAEFIAGRGWLRILLAASLKASGVPFDPRILPIEAGTYGKPRLAERFAAGAPVPEFNVTHARGTVLIALSQAGPVGIDVEYHDDAVEALDIARASFAPAEIAAMERAATERERLALFYRFWTRKEATAKADGRGLRLPFDSFSVAAPGAFERGREMAIAAGAATDQATFYLRDLPLDPGFSGAIALTRPGVPVEMNSLTGVDRLPEELAVPCGNPIGVTDWEVPAGQRGMVTAA